MAAAPTSRNAPRAQKLLAEHEMGELFKVIGFAKGCTLRCHRLCGGRPHAPLVTDHVA